VEAIFWIIGIIATSVIALPLFAMLIMRVDLSVLRPLGEEQMNKLDAQSLRFFEEVVTALEDRGFVDLGYMDARQMMTGIDATIRVLIQPETSTGALVSAMSPHNGPIRRHVELATAFVDDREINTGNASERQPPELLPRKLTLVFPEVQEIEQLLREHEAIARDYARGTPRRELPLQLDAVTFMRHALEQEMQRRIEVGHFRTARQAGRYRLTLHGAFRLTLAELPPLKQVMQRRYRRRAEAIRTQALGH
jgi:hypothetical protein